jgi:radical SAM protein with 4Fe4S-binding SPASM domain
MSVTRAIDPERSGLVYVVWELTLRCDLACGHCGSRAGKGRENELDTDEALEVVRQLAEMGAREVTLIGGEAYLRDDWHVVARAIKDAGMDCTMTTGGRGIDERRARLAREAGIDGVSVSLDGLEEAHDLQRGVRGSFRAACDALGHLRNAGVRITCNTQVNRISFPDLDGVLDRMIAEGCDAWQVQLTVPMGRAADRPEWLLQPYDLLVVMPKLAELKVRAAAHGIRMWPGNNVGYFGPHEHVLKNDIHEDAHGIGCTAGKHVLGIEADGAIKGCPSLPTSAYVGGHVRKRTIREIWDGTRELRYIRDRTVEDLWGYCRSCYYADVCRAGCTWTSHVILGRPGNNPYCHHRALEHARIGTRERMVPVESAPGVPFDHGRFELVVERDDAPPIDAPRWGVDAARVAGRRRLPTIPQS